MKYPDLFAWGGEDELGSGEMGLKQGRTPAGVIPLVAIQNHKEKMELLAPQMQDQSNSYNKTIKLVRYVAVEEIIELIPRGTKVAVN